MTQANAPATALVQARRWAARLVSLRDGLRLRVVLVLVGVTALVLYVLPGLPAPAAHWPMWDVQVYWWGGQQAVAGGRVLYAPGAPFSFTYPPFAALLFAAGLALPFTALMGLVTGISLLALGVTGAIAFRELGWRGARRLGVRLSAPRF